MFVMNVCVLYSTSYELHLFSHETLNPIFAYTNFHFITYTQTGRTCEMKCFHQKILVKTNVVRCMEL